MADMRMEKYEMPMQDPNVRNKNFSEVAIGYDEETAINEAKRCLNCKNRPCRGNCPMHVAIPDFIAEVAKGDFEAAYKIISRSSCLPAVCGRVCPQEVQCEGKCVRGIKGEPVGIGRLERFVADYHFSHEHEKPTPAEKNGHKVAIIGSGPSGLSCAGTLVKLGYEAVVFEALHIPGGILVYGIPEFRLPNATVKVAIDALCDMGVEIRTNVVVGQTITIDELMNEYGYEAIFIGTGAELPKYMNIPGEGLKGVYSANEFLMRINLMDAYKSDAQTPIFVGKKVAVFGGGNVAMDAARCAKRMGADAHIIYRRTSEELPARMEEIELAKEEGINFMYLTAPIELIGDEKGWVKSVRCQKMELSTPDESGRRRPIPIAGTEFEIELDCAIAAIGTAPNPMIKAALNGELATHKSGEIIVDEQTCLTSVKGVYAGGDAVSGVGTILFPAGAGKAVSADMGAGKTVAAAMRAGKTAAAAIDMYIMNNN